MKQVIENGINNAPKAGTSSIFYPRQFVATRNEWVQAMIELYERDDHEGNCPCGSTFVKVVGDYVYGYQLGWRGEWGSVVFTTAEIAGAFVNPLCPHLQKPTGTIEFEERDGWRGDIVAAVQDDMGVWHLAVRYTLPVGNEIHYALFAYTGGLNEFDEQTICESDGILLESHTDSADGTDSEEYWENIIRSQISA